MENATTAMAATRPARSDPANRSEARIALLMQDLSGGGAEKMMLNLAGGLAARGHHVDVVVVRAEGPFLPRVPSGVRVVTPGPRRVSRSIPALARYLRDHQPDAALSSLVHMNVAAVLARTLARVPTRLVLREESRVREPARSGLPPLIRLAYRLLPWAYRRADHVIGVSEGVAQELRDLTGLSTDRVTAIHNPVLTDQDFGVIDAAEPSPHPWFENEAVPVILSVGRLSPVKDHTTLLAAFARLRADRTVRLVILGEGPLRGEIEERARGLGVDRDVLFAGFTDRPFQWMKRATVLAHTARWEGFGNVIVEALACGLPVVATDCPSGPAEILEDGRYGRLVPVGDSQAIAHALTATLDAPPDREFLRSRAARFTVAAVMPRYEAILGVAHRDASTGHR